MKKTLPQYKLMLVREKELQYDHRLDSISDAIDLMIHMGLADAPEEFVYVFCVDCRGSLIAIHEISHGTLTGALVSVRSIYSRALINNSSAIILGHNHPSGNPVPSGDDISITRKIKSAGELLEIPLLDHIIIGSSSTFSMKQNSLL